MGLFSQYILLQNRSVNSTQNLKNDWAIFNKFHQGKFGRVDIPMGSQYMVNIILKC